MSGAKYEPTLRAYDFLVKRATDQKAFSAEQLGEAAGWKPASVKTHLSKKLGQLVERVGTKYRVKQEILRMSKDQFLEHMTQVKPIFTQYVRTKHDHLLTYEFLLPLTREDKLRRTLDDLFFTDTIQRRVAEVGLTDLAMIVARAAGQSDAEYAKMVLARASQISGGYSISHASGRFRAGDLVSRHEAGTMLAADRRYLIDETTAVVRFLIPLNAGSVDIPDDFSGMMTTLDTPAPFDPKALRDEIRTARLLFFELFVEAIARTIQGEDEIWLIEESPDGRRLYKWSRSS